NVLIGYMRPYNDDQTCVMQLTELKKFNCDRIIAEDHSSAKKRTQLRNIIDNLKQGDKIIIAKLYYLADSTRHIVELLQKNEEKGACIESIKEGVDTSNRYGYQFSYIVKYLVKYESDEIGEKIKK